MINRKLDIHLSNGNRFTIVGSPMQLILDSVHPPVRWYMKARIFKTPEWRPSGMLNRYARNRVAGRLGIERPRGSDRKWFE